LTYTVIVSEVIVFAIGALLSRLLWATAQSGSSEEGNCVSVPVLATLYSHLKDCSKHSPFPPSPLFYIISTSLLPPSSATLSSFAAHFHLRISKEWSKRALIFLFLTTYHHDISSLGVSLRFPSMAAPFAAYQRPEMATSSTTLLPKPSLASLTSTRASSSVRFFSPFCLSSFRTEPAYSQRPPL
jgi:hypothetical protein